MHIFRFILCCIIVWFSKVSQSNGRQQMPTPNTDLDSKFKRLSQTLESLDKIQKKDFDDSLRSIHGVGRNQQSSEVLPDEGSGLSDDDDYTENSGSEPVDESLDPDSDGDLNRVSTSRHGEDGIDISTVVIFRGRTDLDATTERITTSATVSTAATSTIASTTRTYKSSITSRPAEIGSTRKTVDLSHVESSEYDPKRDAPRKGCSNLSPVLYVNIAMASLLFSIRWLWRL